MAVPDVPPRSRLRSEMERAGLIVHDVRLRRTGVNPISDIAYVLKLYLLIRKSRPDMVLSYTAKPVIYATLASYIGRVPCRFALITGLGHAFTTSNPGFVSRVVAVLYRIALSRADKVFFQNPDDQEEFQRRNVISRRKYSIVVNGSGVNLTDYTAVPVPEGPPVFLMIARLLGDKGVREYVAAAARIRSTSPDARFVLAGWIDENPDAISKAELDTWIENGDIEFVGRLDDVRQVLAESSVYVLPSYREGTPRTVLEAMATGRAIITTDTPGCRETVIHQKNGFLVPAKSIDALVSAMQEMIDDRRLICEMGKYSRQIVEEKYDVDKVNAVILQEMGID